MRAHLVHNPRSRRSGSTVRFVQSEFFFHPAVTDLSPLDVCFVRGQLGEVTDVSVGRNAPSLLFAECSNILVILQKIYEEPLLQSFLI